MTKPDQILILEKEIQTELNLLDNKYAILDYGNGNRFELNSKNEIIGLNLEGIKIIDVSVLSSFNKLEKLAISNANFSDYSFFKN
ncbi:hypothetical protein [Flavobacterium sp. YO12]|uniref:hypothetical protein n=1 Tax=Flavobacterium sp. YO12 TaxID=1920029 RepID=UPI00100AEB4F|nr:hypothetical protein [Flavobacterium sp. YO12]RXM47081.1 hypothetical protein BOW55_12835 [Flavobacterium sp. YO12]